GSAISTGGDVVIQTNGNAALVDGNHQITATQIIGSQVESSRSLAQTITIDTVAPIVDYAFSFEHEQRVDIFPNDVVQFSDLIFHNETDNTTLMGNQLSLTSNGVSMSVYKASGLFSNGNWHVSGPGPTDLAGNSPGAIDFDFYVLAGDANRDRVVNFADLLIIAQRYNTSNNGFSQGNFDYSSNGLVDFSDLLIVAQNYNVSVPAALLSAQRQRGALALLEDRAERWLA
ncbi:MAG TPA: hypothetical protein PK402_13410, partial [Tepidisphaeraceae bacterium]|nr:hypothetical protein [Tepidisphaeraceae bacterium]